jgi:hypothetical protein
MTTPAKPPVREVGEDVGLRNGSGGSESLQPSAGGCEFHHAAPTPRATDHDINCEFHTDQRPQECTCGLTALRPDWFVPGGRPWRCETARRLAVSKADNGESTMSRSVEYKITPVTRFLITRSYSETDSAGRGLGGCEPFGTFDSEQQADRVRQILVSAEEQAEAGTPIKAAE